MVKPNVLFAVYLAMATSVLIAQTPSGHATVSGRVVDAAGNPVANADVSYMPLDHDEANRPVRTLSQPDGSYAINVSAPGKIRIYVYKDSANVPNKRATLFESAQEHYTELVVEEGQALTGVEVTLPAPYGTLSVRVIDALTRLPIPKAQLVLSFLETPANRLSASSLKASFHFALPDRPITALVQAPGYRSWSYADVATGHNYLKIASSDAIDLTVELLPE